MRFTKMHGCGNDYVYVDCFRERVDDPRETARRVSDRHFGIGSDGLILIKPSKRADFAMAMYNADGSEGAMCGNGIRCLAKYVYDKGLTSRKQISVETRSGIKHLILTVKDQKVSEVQVDMGRPELTAAKIPVRSETERAQNVPVRIRGRDFLYTAVSMGNPHAVVQVKDAAGLDLARFGPEFECYRDFPDRINTEFVEILDPETIRMRVWERGSGETLACGTGACAAAVAAVENGWIRGRSVTVRLAGGELKICWDRQSGSVFMTGPAATVFEGEIKF
ncbi:MAG TPA: diaminopimelate epimerase [Candidatus Scatomonas pullistercoris]|uniref:Diaminopimelate epimerase n=1 Tax=Candidatus Scatomonas pullistercoris TaxID=2840920 RepID=A0A9D1TA15_9FIRM|nr:diaminopimelate epimerase [Candidatus Scatomonas pullistercoris]